MNPHLYTAISRRVVGKSARYNPERYCGWFRVLCSSRKCEKLVREATDICLRVLKESNKSMFDRYSRQEQCIDHIPYYLSGLSRAHFFSDNLSRNSCIKYDARGWCFQRNCVGDVLHVSWNPYPISDQNLWFSLPYFRPNQKFDTLFQIWSPGARRVNA